MSKKDNGKTKPWVLIMEPWNVNKEPMVIHQYSEQQCVDEAMELLLKDRHQTAYIGLMTRVMGVKKSKDSLGVISSDARDGGEAWKDHFAKDWPGTGPEGE